MWILTLVQSTLLTDASFLDLCIRLAKLETKMDWLVGILAAVGLALIGVLLQNNRIHKLLKNGCKK